MSEKIAQTVAALLAKAADKGATREEAESFAAGAQRLMAKHGITAAMLAAAEEKEEPLTEWRVAIRPTYFRADIMLLDAIARPNGCRVAYFARPKVAEVTGHASDVENVKMMWAVLLPQVERLGRRQRAPLDFWGESEMSDTAWRRSWRYGFAVGVYQKLLAAQREAAEEVATEQGHGAALVVMDQRMARVDAAMAAQKTRKARAVTANDEALAAGRAAGWGANVGTEQGLNA
jgi:hypothetical protein